MINKYKKSVLSNYTMLWLMVILFIIFSIMITGFGTVRNSNVWAVGRVNVGFIALGCMIPLAAGELDISLGYLMGASIMTGGYFAINFGTGEVATMLIVILTGALLGAFNGFMVTVVGVPSTITTLGSGFIFYGISLGLNNCRSFNSCFSADFVKLFTKTRILGFNVLIYALLAVCLILWYVLEKTPFGKNLYAVGLSNRVAFLAGINTRLVRFMSFTLAGLVVGIGGALYFATSGNAVPDTGPTFLNAGLAMAFLSITTHKVGRYNAVGTFLSVMFLGMVVNASGLLGAPSWFEGVANGLVLIGVVLFSGAEARKAAVG